MEEAYINNDVVSFRVEDRNIEWERRKVFVYWEDTYRLYRFSQKSIDWFGVSKKNQSAWLLSIDWTDIFTHDILEEYLQYALINEVICSNVLEKKWWCKEALIQEIKVVPESIRYEYIEWRKEFFKNMYSYYTDDIKEPSKENQNYALEMKDCYKYLEKLNIDTWEEVRRVMNW